MVRKQFASERRDSKGTFWAAVLAVGVGGAAHAASIDWDNETGNGRYVDPMNWSTNAVPVAEDDAAFVNLAAGPASIAEDVTNGPRDFRFGDDGRTGGGVVNHTAGSLAMPGWVRMGINTGSEGTYNLSGGTLQAGNFRIAESAGTTATVNVTGGTLRQSDVGDIANGDNWARIGQDGAATFNLSNGAVSFDARVIVAGAPVSSANITQSGGSFEVRRGELTIGDQGAATYNITAGTLRTLSSDGGADTGGHITVGQWDNSVGTLNVGGTALVEAGVHLQLADGRGDGPTSTGTVNQTGGTVRVGTTGNGNLTLATNAPGVATYNLSGGVLDLTGGNITRGAGNGTFVMTGGRLQNVGSTNIPLTLAGGTLSISEGIGSTTAIGGDFTLAAPATLEIDSMVLNEGAIHDRLAVNGIVNLAGMLSLVGDFGEAGTPLVILENDGADAIIGNFLGLPEGSTFNAAGSLFQITYSGGTGNDVALTVVPEPGSLGAVALALAGLLGRRRARRC